MSSLLRIHFSPLSIFKNINGNLLVPIKYIVPQIPAWPSQFHNLKLGQVVNKLRIDIKKNKLTSNDLTELASIGFVPDVKKYQSERALLGFQEYKRIKGDCNLQQNYTIPESNDWPGIVHGLKLGVIQNNMRQDINKYSAIRDAVTELGFNLIPTENNGYDFPRTYDALVAHKAIHGDVNVVRDFVVPHGDARYPENTWGIKLGQNLHSIRCQGAWSEHRAQLESLGVIYEVKPLRREPFDVIYSAFECYKAIHGHVHIVLDFVVPHGNARFPENTWGMKLGLNLNNCRCNGAWSEHRAQLEALGVNYEVKPVRREPFDVIYSALESYKAIHGDVNVVRGFVVPHGDARYPENTWGMKLGIVVSNIRHRGIYAMHRDKLQLLGLTVASKASNHSNTTGKGVSGSSVDSKATTTNKMGRKLKL